ncbi:7-cyano-7-deazaguanine/7-aminomethyl-7-deazaguanine transporter [Psychrobacter sp. TAE2020]|uniref:7-cyano-7-deazaguanine/7-aminomethyl-7- deazaguanine transporter n=1 Tax=Psychrobacter sp. TAE2020 TaxID=2846762 RepID=UPI001C11B863|nr:7-cyano-7-deazaguanine/7-aminomethyl-7-deazaguanine transporter [Psychrobacter sp. TAE2020]MBU5616340.1 7-cyano-7-deazaguanine/7-aminomethyl-7-deazaguanine transporter [Psychrobacter sp. TAE2020]
MSISNISITPLQSIRYSRALFWLVGLHIFIIAISNYLVQIPVGLFGFITTWGAITFPFIFLITDLTVRIFGQQLARRIIFFAMLPALVISYYFSVVFANGLFVGHEKLLDFNLFVFRIVLASFAAYVVGQLLDIQVFNKLRQLKTWWIAPLVSTFIGNLIDSLCFFAIAFYRSPDAFMATHWIEIGTMDYLFKMVMGVLIFLPLYGVVLAKLQKMLAGK